MDAGNCTDDSYAALCSEAVGFFSTNRCGKYLYIKYPYYEIPLSVMFIRKCDEG